VAKVWLRIQTLLFGSRVFSGCAALKEKIEAEHHKEAVKKGSG